MWISVGYFNGPGHPKRDSLDQESDTHKMRHLKSRRGG